ncbi:MAG: TolC family protein [Gemmataceae bacterium]|nr:TolC family protein [Gemmataceae bacterium]
MTRSGQDSRRGGTNPRWLSALFAIAVLLPNPMAAAQPLELPPLRQTVEPEAVTEASQVPLPPPPTIGAGEAAAEAAQPREAEPLPPPVKVQSKDLDKQVPLSLDAVLGLAMDQNGMVRLAREKLAEAYVEQELAAKRWLPELWLGVGWWRHDGGIQDFFGNLLETHYGSSVAGMELRGKLDMRDAVFTRLEALRKVRQQQGEVSRFNAEQLLDAASTYLDLLAAQGAAAITIDAELKLQKLQVQAKSLEKIDPGTRVEVARVESELGAQKILTRRLQEGAKAAKARIIYLLGLDPASEVVVLEKFLVALQLVEVGESAAPLVELAQQQGPGVRETEAILGLLEEMRAKGESPLHWLPRIEVTMGEGAFGAGPGGRLDWANRWDVGVQARWNVTELLTGRERKRLAALRIQQAQLNYQDLRGKLTLAIQEAHEAVRSNHEQLKEAARQIQHAEEAYSLSDLRLRENIKGRSPSEVLLAIRALVGARLSYLHALRDYDKAQVRLFVFTGAAGTACPPR